MKYAELSVGTCCIPSKLVLYSDALSKLTRLSLPSSSETHTNNALCDRIKCYIGTLEWATVFCVSRVHIYRHSVISRLH